MAGRLEGKVAIVTGAGAGIGQAAATRFAREGARINAITPGTARTALVDGGLSAV